MLITFSVENWRCFRDRATLHMAAGSESQHAERLPSFAKFRLKLLPIAALYGANASGKSKFAEALAFLQHLILKGTSQNERLGIHRFKLDSKSLRQPSTFKIDLLLEGFVWTYEISLFPDRILSERLVIENSASTYEVFSREADLPIRFGNNILFKKEDLPFLHFIEKATRPNQPFLTNAVLLNLEKFKPFYKWFEERLTIILPSGEFLPIHRFADPTDVLSGRSSQIMRELGTGIDHFESERIDERESAAALFNAVPNALKARLSQPNAFIRLGDRILRIEKEEPVVERLVAVHRNREGGSVRFSLNEESDGTKRMLDLIPAFTALEEPSGHTVIVDELDHSLHTKLLEHLIRTYLDGVRPESRSQLIFTTHDVNILTQRIFRRDELWGVDKGPDGAAELYSFRDFKGIRSDKDIRKVYLSGLLGAVPTIG